MFEHASDRELVCILEESAAAHRELKREYSKVAGSGMPEKAKLDRLAEIGTEADRHYARWGEAMRELARRKAARVESA